MAFRLFGSFVVLVLSLAVLPGCPSHPSKIYPSSPEQAASWAIQRLQKEDLPSIALSAEDRKVLGVLGALKAELAPYQQFEFSAKQVGATLYETYGYHQTKQYEVEVFGMVFDQTENHQKKLYRISTNEVDVLQVTCVEFYQPENVSAYGYGSRSKQGSYDTQGTSFGYGGYGTVKAQVPAEKQHATDKPAGGAWSAVSVKGKKKAPARVRCEITNAVFGNLIK